MAILRVKQKFRPSTAAAVLAAGTFAASWAGVFPSRWVESTYAGGLFPTISHMAGLVSDAVPFSLLDLAIAAAVALAAYGIRARKGRILVAALSGAYLWFFWTWGLNYHRMPLETKLALDRRSVSRGDVEALARTAAAELNRLWPAVSNERWDKRAVAESAAARVRAVVSKIHDRDWPAAGRVKRSIFAEGWFRIAGVDGMFNPFGHEPVVASGLLGFELPFVISHEFAHVRGVPDEGDANLLALFATATSEAPSFQYSGWFHLWLYLRDPERDEWLAQGPRRDLALFFERARSQQIPWVSRLQATILDWHLRAHDVGDGVRSYSRFVTLAVAARRRGLM